MNSKNLINPFVVGKYISPEYFCDREMETANLIKQIKNGRNVALISPRRMGKTGLIEHCFQQEEISDNYYLFYIDIYATTSFSEFVYLFGKTIYEQLKPKKSQFKEKFFNFLTSLRVGFKLDKLTGEPTFDIGLGDIQTPTTTLDEIFNYLESADKPCVVAIDEFQQIREYPDKNIEALLRTKIQQCKQTSFIFCGSKRHMMSNIFNSPSKPFYQSVNFMGLSPIPLETYIPFAKRMFNLYSKYIEDSVIKQVYTQFNGCTWFVQLMMNELFAITTGSGYCSTDKIETAWENIISQQEINYKEQMALLPPKQKLILLAIAKEGKAYNITSADFIKRHNLVSASSVQSAIRTLVKNDIITKDGNCYKIYDYFFAEWLKQY